MSNCTYQLPDQNAYPASVPQNQVKTLTDLLCLRAHERPAQTVYQFLRNGEECIEPLTYSQLHSGARSVASLLRGISAGDRVILAFPAGVEFIQAFFGCLYAGAIPVMLPAPRGRGRGLEALELAAHDCGASAILTTETLLRRVASRLPEFPKLNGLEWETFETAAKLPITVHQPAALNANSAAFLQYTSGSTAHPKGVVVSHYNVLENQRLLREVFSHTSETVIAGWLPHYHDMGLVGLLLHPVFLGSRCYFSSPEAFLQDPSRWLRAISRYRAQTSAAPTFAYELAAERVHSLPSDVDLSCWRTAIVGAEPVRKETLHRFGDKFSVWGFRKSAFCPCYGLAEATLFVTGGHWNPDGDDSDHATVPCGPSVGHQEIAIVDPNQRVPVAPGDLGEIWVRGPSVASSYWGRPVENEQIFGAHLQNGIGPFLRTQDLGRLSPGGLIVAGRLKNMVIFNGCNYFAEDIEAALYGSHPATANGRVAAFSQTADGKEQLVVLQEIIPSPVDSLNVDAICGSMQKALGSSLGITASTIGLLSYGAIPRTTSGKIRYAECYRMFSGGSLVPWAVRTFQHASSPTRSELNSSVSWDCDSLEDWLTERIAHRLSIDTGMIVRTDSFAALGLCSVDIIEITEQLAKELGTPLDPTLFWEFPSIAEAATGLARTIN